MTKKETIKFILQMIASIATAIVTALGTSSCMGVQRKERGSRNKTCEPLFFIRHRATRYSATVKFTILNFRGKDTKYF